MLNVAVSLKTESGDSYTFLFEDVKSPEHFASLVHDQMGDELGYVFDYDLDISGGLLAGEFEDALTRKIYDCSGEDEDDQ